MQEFFGTLQILFVLTYRTLHTVFLSPQYVLQCAVWKRVCVALLCTGVTFHGATQFISFRLDFCNRQMWCSSSSLSSKNFMTLNSDFTSWNFYFKKSKYEKWSHCSHSLLFIEHYHILKCWFFFSSFSFCLMIFLKLQNLSFSWCFFVL